MRGCVVVRILGLVFVMVSLSKFESVKFTEN